MLFLGPLILTAMGSISLVVCYQALFHLLSPQPPKKKTIHPARYVVPRLKPAAALDSVVVSDVASDVFSNVVSVVVSDSASVADSNSVVSFEDAKESTPRA